MQTKNRRAFLVLLMVFAVGSLVTPSIGGGTSSEEKGLVVVNGSVVPKADLDRAIQHLKKRYAEAGKDLSDAKLADIEKTTIESLIDNELLYQESQKMGIQTDNASVDWQFQATKNNYETKEAFENWLKEMHLSEAALKDQFRRRDAINLLINKHIAQKFEISDKEIKDYYGDHLDDFKKPEEVRVSHILINVDPQTNEADKEKARKTLEDIQKELKKGKDFSALAKEFSQCPSSAKGGDLGYIFPGMMTEPFEKAAYGLKPGEISDIVETEFGYHLIKVTEKMPEHIIPYEEAKAAAEQRLRHEKTQKQLIKYIAQLKEKATINKLVTEKP